MTPTFDPDVTEYTATTANASDGISATPADEGATIAIESDTATIDSGKGKKAASATTATATWTGGSAADVVTITVSPPESQEKSAAVEGGTVYTVTVTSTYQNEAPEQ